MYISSLYPGEEETEVQPNLNLPPVAITTLPLFRTQHNLLILPLDIYDHEVLPWQRHTFTINKSNGVLIWRINLPTMSTPPSP